MGGRKKARATSVEAFLASRPEALRPTLAELHALVLRLVPEATDKVAYGRICFHYHYLLVGVGSKGSWASLHVMDPELLASIEDSLVGIRHSKATLHFAPGKPLPRRQIADLVCRRARENERRAAEQAAPRNSPEHYNAAHKAARAAALALPFFERQHPSDRRPRDAIEAITAWASGKQILTMAETRRLSLAAHAAARSASDAAAQAAARAAGHAVATWHVPSHAEGARLYAAKARRLAAPSLSP